MQSLKISSVILSVLFSGIVRAEVQNQCSGEIVVVSYNCANMMEGSNSLAKDDIRFYLMEFQACENGKIKELDRSIMGLYVKDQADPSLVYGIYDDKIKVNYSEQRTTLPDRVDDLTVLAPKSATMAVGDLRFNLSMTTEKAPDFEGASDDQSHFIGSYQKLNNKGQLLGGGELSCSISR